MRRVSETSLFNAAVFYLERYSATTAHLRRVLKRKAARVPVEKRADGAQLEAWLDAVCARLTRAGYLDDARVAASRTASLQRAGKSTRFIRQALRGKGVPAPMVTALTAQTDDAEAAWTAARKRRLGPYRVASARDANRQKDLARLVRAGFAYGLARTIVDAPEPR